MSRTSEYLTRTLKLFPPGTLVLMITRDKDGELRSDICGCAGIEAGEAIKVLACATLTLERHALDLVAAAAAGIEDPGKTPEEKIAFTASFFKACLDKQREDTEESYQAAARSERIPDAQAPGETPPPKLVLAGASGVCECPKPALPHAGMSKGAEALTCKRCGKPVAGGRLAKLN